MRTKTWGALALAAASLGGLATPLEAQWQDTLIQRAFNEVLHRDERVDLSLLPLGDGLTLARKRG